MHYIQEVYELVGEASRCWAEEGGKGVFDEQRALKIADRFCDMFAEAKGPMEPAQLRKRKMRVRL